MPPFSFPPPPHRPASSPRLRSPRRPPPTICHCHVQVENGSAEGGEDQRPTVPCSPRSAQGDPRPPGAASGRAALWPRVRGARVCAREAPRFLWSGRGSPAHRGRQWGPGGWAFGEGGLRSVPAWRLRPVAWHCPPPAAQWRAQETRRSAGGGRRWAGVGGAAAGAARCPEV